MKNTIKDNVKINEVNQPDKNFEAKKREFILKKFIELYEQAKEVNKLLDEYKDRVKQIFEEENINIIEVEDYSIIKTVVEQNRFDTTTFKKENEEMYNKYCKKSSQIRIDVKKR